jgi:hypothetical protein
MRKIRTDWIENRTARNEVVRQPVDVWGDDNATDEIFRGTGVSSDSSNLTPRPSSPETNRTYPDATFTPQDSPLVNTTWKNRAAPSFGIITCGRAGADDGVRVVPTTARRMDATKDFSLALTVARTRYRSSARLSLFCKRCTRPLISSRD